ncbi:MAG: tetratricopeptide repeat protein, partial [Candidatus Binatia bacterium]
MVLGLGLGFLPVAFGQETAPKAASAPSVREILDRADKLMAQKNYQAARAEYERARSIDQGSERAWRSLGWSLWQLGEKKQALQVWNDILKVLPESPSILLAMAQAHEQDRRWKEALDYYGRVLKVNPNHEKAKQAQARIHRSMAETSVQTAKPDDAIGQYQRSLQARPGHRSTLKSLTDLYQTQHRYAEAVAVLRPFVAANPNDDDIRERLARMSEYAGDYRESETQWRTLISKHPKEARYQIQLAGLLKRGGQTPAAIAVAKDVLKNEPANADALGLLADEADFGGRTEEAVEWLNRLVAAQPSAKRLNQLGELQLTLGRNLDNREDSRGARGHYVAAAEAFRKAGELEPVSADARLGYITAIRLQGKLDQAIELAEKLHAQYPSSQRTMRELYDAYMQAGRYDDARRHHLALVKASPAVYRLKREGAFMSFARGDREEAIAALEEMREEQLRPNVPVLLYHGITESPAEEATSVKDFREHMQALRKAGYETIGVRDLIAFLDGKNLPQKKPILITFDDARADSFRHGDPILKEVGFQAVMFVAAAEIDRHIPFYASWETIREKQTSGRWDM